MKNKSAVLFAFSLVLGLMGLSYAASGVRGAKASQGISLTTNSIGVSTGPAVLYAIYLSTGASTDFVALFDSNSVVGLTGTSMSTALGYKMRFYSTGISSTTAVFTLDPPIQFFNGIMAIPSSAGLSSLITFEKGRVGQGY